MRKKIDIQVSPRATLAKKAKTIDEFAPVRHGVFDADERDYENDLMDDTILYPYFGGWEN